MTKFHTTFTLVVIQVTTTRKGARKADASHSISDFGAALQIRRCEIGVWNWGVLLTAVRSPATVRRPLARIVAHPFHIRRASGVTGAMREPNESQSARRTAPLLCVSISLFLGLLSVTRTLTTTTVRKIATHGLNSCRFKK